MTSFKTHYELVKVLNCLPPATIYDLPNVFNKTECCYDELLYALREWEEKKYLVRLKPGNLYLTYLGKEYFRKELDRIENL